MQHKLQQITLNTFPIGHIIHLTFPRDIKQYNCNITTFKLLHVVLMNKQNKEFNFDTNIIQTSPLFKYNYTANMYNPDKNMKLLFATDNYLYHEFINFEFNTCNKNNEYNTYTFQINEDTQ